MSNYFSQTHLRRSLFTTPRQNFFSTYNLSGKSPISIHQSLVRSSESLRSTGSRAMSEIPSSSRHSRDRRSIQSELDSLLDYRTDSTEYIQKLESHIKEQRKMYEERLKELKGDLKYLHSRNESLQSERDFYKNQHIIQFDRRGPDNNV